MNGSTSTSKIGFEEPITFENNKILYGEFFEVEYSIDKKKAEFRTKVTFDESEINDEKNAFKKVVMTIYQIQFVQICYLAVADMNDVDLGLAYQYFSENLKDDTSEVDSDIVNYVSSEDDKQMEFSCEIDLTKLKKLTIDDVNKNTQTEVTIIEE